MAQAEEQVWLCHRTVEQTVARDMAVREYDVRGLRKAYQCEAGLRFMKTRRGRGSFDSHLRAAQSEMDEPYRSPSRSIAACKTSGDG